MTSSRSTKTTRSRNRTRAGKAKPRKAAGAAGRAPAAEFNHAMVYTRDLARALRFYRDALGLQVIDEYPGAYARLRAARSTNTIALHVLDPGQELDPARGGVRLYFEVRRLDALCARLAAGGVAFSQPPRDMPWGWRHAYLKDPDGHELSLYWAGARRLRRTRMADEDH